MKLTQFQELWQVVNLYELDRISQTEVKDFAEQGLTTNLSDVFQTDNEELITVLADGTIRKTVAYISEIESSREEKNYPRFHIFNCGKLVEMRKNNRSYRYKKTSRMDGSFLMVLSDRKGYSYNKFSKLKICQDCLKKYNKLYGLNPKYKVEDFDIRKYMKMPINQYVDDLNNLYFEDDLETVPKHYAKNWKEISNELKRQKNYTCQKCGINLQDAKKYLHTHHIDGNPSNNIVSNLKVLCIECHAKEFRHGHIKNNPMYNKFIAYKKECGY